MSLPTRPVGGVLTQGVRAIAASQHRSGGLRPEPRAASQPFGRSSHIASDALLALFLFLIIFGLPGLFAGV